MTYCLAAQVESGLVFISDSRTNAGIDQLGIYSKMHVFDDLDGRFFTLLSAGNLATTQAVVARLRRDLRDSAETSLASVTRMREAADYVGEISLAVQEKYAGHTDGEPFNAEANFIFGGRIGTAKPELFHVYPQGNYVAPTTLAPFLQIGEQKYGKPILDRIIRYNTDIETVMRCGLVSMDSTMRSNAGVGAPIEMMVYRFDGKGPSGHLVFEEDDPYLQKIREAWEQGLRAAFDYLPDVEWPDPDHALRVIESDSAS